MKCTKLKFALLLILTLLIACSHTSPNATKVKSGPFRNADAKAAYSIDTLIHNSPTEMAFWGVQVQDAKTGEIIYSKNPNKIFMPASNMKLYTTSTALQLLGPDYRYHTAFTTTGSIENGTLLGDIIINGSGDPTWSWRFFNDSHDSLFIRFADSLKALGINKIDGRIIGNDNIFDDQALGYGWSWDDEPYYYAAQLSGLSYNENYVDVIVTPGEVGELVHLEKRPNTHYLTIKNELVTVHPDSTGKWNNGRDRATNKGWFRGEFSASKEKKEDALTVENPTLFTATLFKEVLESQGITVSGEPVDLDDLFLELDSTLIDTLFLYTSHPMSKIIEMVNKPSQNFIAETLLKTIGVELGKEGSTEEGIRLEMEMWDSLGMNTRDLKILDGSGLSRHNVVSPYHTTTLLQLLWEHEYRDIFIESLPIAGIEESTLENRMKNSIAAGRVHAKTGYIGRARTLSGYVYTLSGRTIIFSIMVNHYTVPTSDINELQDKIGIILARL